MSPVVIVSGGEAGTSDLTTVGGFDEVKGTANAAYGVSEPRNCVELESDVRSLARLAPGSR
jgi:hypothetical protein